MSSQCDDYDDHQTGLREVQNEDLIQEKLARARRSYKLTQVCC